MKYCADCRVLCEYEKCDICGNDDLREAIDDDFCFLLQCEELFGDVVESALSDSSIKCAKVPFGNGARKALGLNLGNYKIYVQYQHYDEAKTIVKSLTTDPTDRLREELLTNFDRWHVSKKSALKRIYRKLELAADVDFYIYLKDKVSKSDKISDDGLILSCAEGGHYYSLTVNDRKIWFNSATFEIFI